MTTIQNDLTDRLDRLETSLPTIPSKGLALYRASTRRVIDTTTDVASTVARRIDSVRGTAETSTKTTVGQATSAASRTASVASTAVRQAAGQASAEASQVVDAAADATEQLLDDGTQAADPDRPNPGVPYSQWTKAQLYERAQELDVDGRSSMSKTQLVSALRAS